MFSGLRSDSVALSHVWLGLLGGRFQSGRGTRHHRATSVSCKKGKGSPYSITELRVPELIPVLGSQPALQVT